MNHAQNEPSSQPEDDLGPGTIRINDLILTVSYSTTTSPLQKILRPVSLSVSISVDPTAIAQSNELSYNIKYAAVANRIQEFVKADLTGFASLEDFVLKVTDLLLCASSPFRPHIHELRLKLVQSDASNICKLTISSTAKRCESASWNVIKIRHGFEDISCQAIIGPDLLERPEKQTVQLNILIEGFNEKLAEGWSLPALEFTRMLRQSVEKTSFMTLEAMASFTALGTLRCLRNSPGGPLDPLVTVKAAQAGPLQASAVEVELCRSYKHYPEFRSAPSTLLEPHSTQHVVAIALGSNIGDRFYNIELALRLLEQPEMQAEQDIVPVSETLVNVVDTSFMYESAPMYLTDQPAFANCACVIETNLDPLALLRHLKNIEHAVGRVPSIRNGPRAIDLDIVVYDTITLDTRPASERQGFDNLQDQLVVPHPKMAEREFVLRPLNDIIPHYIHPISGKSISALLAGLDQQEGGSIMQKVIPFPYYPLQGDSVLGVPTTLTCWPHPATASAIRKTKTRLMATLNVTPDSFSDGAMRNNLPAALSYATESVEAGAAILDIGGCSTRPGAAFVSVEEELNRVVPVVRAIRGSCGSDKLESAAHANHALLRDLPISIDTYRWEVAKASIEAGANCINDVYAFTGPDSYPFSPDTAMDTLNKMKAVARDFAVPMVLMHSRGDAGQNKDYSQYTFARRGSVLEGVCVELGEKVNLIVKGKGGVRRWLVIVDPGIGFSKTLNGNLEVLRQGRSITADVIIGKDGIRRANPLAGFPTLVGVSRKSFLGAILAEGEKGRSAKPSERVFATAAAVVAAVEQFATIIRAHDIKEMADVVRVADALWT